MGFRVCSVSVGAGVRGAAGGGGGGGGGTAGELRTGPGFGKSVAIMATIGVDNCKVTFSFKLFLGNLNSPNTYPLECHYQSVVYPLPQLIVYCIQSSCVHDFSFDANSVSSYC